MSSHNHASVSTAGHSTVVIDQGLDLLNRVQMYQIAINKINLHKSKATMQQQQNLDRKGLATAGPGQQRNIFKFGSTNGLSSMKGEGEFFKAQKSEKVTIFEGSV